MYVSNKNIDDYEKNGAIVLRSIFTEWIEILSAGIDKLMSDPSPRERSYNPEDGSAPFFQDLCNWNRFEEFDSFIKKSPLGEIAAKLMKSKKSRFFHDHVLVKEQGSSIVTPWHQDQPYYCVNGKDNCSFWIPLDPIQKNVCPEFICGSHKWNKQFIPTKFKGYSYTKQDDEFEKIPDIDNNRENYKIVSWILDPGDVIAFNFSTVHGAPGNNSNNRRRAFSARFIGSDATFIKRKGETSPPFPEIELKDGDKMDSPTFPIVLK